MNTPDPHPLSSEHSKRIETLIGQLSLPEKVSQLQLESVQLYLRYPRNLDASQRLPHCRLVGFESIELAPGQSTTVPFTITAAQMALIDTSGAARIEPGTFEVIAAGASPSERSQALGAAKPVRAKFNVDASSDQRS